MVMTLQKEAWQSGLALSDEREEWNINDWPPLEGGARDGHATVVLDHPVTSDNHNDKAQTVVVMGGYQRGHGEIDSVLALNLAEANKQWREGPRMNKKRDEHAAVVCNGGVYVMGGYNGVGRSLDCMERIDVNDLLQSSSTSSSTHESHWKTLNCRLSTGRDGCCAVAVLNRYIVVMGGHDGRQHRSLVDIIDTNNHSVLKGSRLTVTRSSCASAVIGHRIYVVGGENGGGNVDSVEYLDFATPCENDERKKETGSTFISFSSTWITHSDLVLSNGGGACTVVAVGSCLVVAGEWNNSTVNSTVEVLDTHRNRVWNLPSIGNRRDGCSMVTVANQIAAISGSSNPSSVTLPLLDKNTRCFRRLCEQQPNGWYHFLEGMGISPF